MEIELLGAHLGAGLTLLLESSALERFRLHRTQKLEISFSPMGMSMWKPGYHVAKYKQHQPPTITQQLKRFGNWVGGIFGYSQPEHVQYHPIVNGEIRLVEQSSIRSCTHRT